MILDKPLLGKVYEGQTYLTSGMLHEDDGRILLELHNAGAGPKDDYLDQFDPSCISQQGNGVIAIGSPRMKPCPETISFFTGPQESSYLLTDCRLVDTNFAFGGGPYNSRQVIEVGRLIQLSDGGLNRFGNKYLKINRMQSTIPMLNMWLGDSALFFWLPNDDNAKQRTVVAYGLKKTKPIKIGSISNENTVYAHIQVQAGSSDNLGKGKVELHSDTTFSTYSRKNLDINDHFRLHQSFLVLLETAYGCKLDMRSIRVSRNEDKPSPKYSATFRDLLMPHMPTLDFKEARNAGKAEPIFYFKNINEEGTRKWFGLLHDCPMGLYAFSNILENEKYLPLETQFLLVGVTIEHIGAMVQGHDSCFREQLNAILDQIAPLLGDDASKTDWIDGVTKSYNGIKHFYRADKRPDTVSMIEYLIEAKQIIRLWIAHHIGCSIDLLKEYMSRHRYQLSRVTSIFDKP